MLLVWLRVLANWKCVAILTPSRPGSHLATSQVVCFLWQVWRRGNASVFSEAFIGSR